MYVRYACVIRHQPQTSFASRSPVHSHCCRLLVHSAASIAATPPGSDRTTATINISTPLHAWCLNA
jgi:hypothetical protein